ncbi:hypothetical protein [Roseibium sp.]|uniref:hypothetical protein n=1 Tax=Roseibium sp. TaxID=1936156 RepID=UPI003B520FCB
MTMSLRKISLLAAAATAIQLSACADHMAHKDGVTFGAGSAVEANIGIHTVDPFPRAAYRTQMVRDGKSVVKAQERYLEPGDPDIDASAADNGLKLD